MHEIGKVVLGNGSPVSIDYSLPVLGCGHRYTNSIRYATSGRPQAISSGLITQVVMAKGVDPVSAGPVDPITVFDSSSVVHATVKISDAPANTKFTAAFYVVDVGGAAAPNSLITSTDITADGTRYLDFTLAPTSSWPSGKYRLDISVNDQLDQTVPYTVQ